MGPRRDITVPTSNGLLTFDSKDWLIGKYLFVERSYETEQLDRAVALLRREGYLTRKGGTVVDVGANIGMICIALLQRGYFERALAFEPAPNNYRLLVRNVSQNGMQDRISAFPYALSASEGELELELSTENSGDNRIRTTTAPGAYHEENRPTVKVEGKTLDQVFAGIPGLTAEETALVWVDIQGHEGHFFEGAKRTLGCRIPVVAELWPYGVLRSGLSAARFLDVVSGLFSHFYLLSDREVAKQPIRRIDGLFHQYGEPRQWCQVALVQDQ